MLKRAIDRWRSIIGGRPAVTPCLEPCPTAYQPSFWFEGAWRTIGAGEKPAIEALLSDAAIKTRDAAERACLTAGWFLLFGDAPTALAQADAALTERPDFPHAHVLRARALRARGERRAALSAFQRATALWPDDACTWVEQAEEHLAHGETEQARDCYNLALAHAPDHLIAHAGLARVLRDAGNPKVALDHVRHALRISPRDATLYFELAVVCSGLDDVPGSMAAYERALELDPACVAACINLGLIHLGNLNDPLGAQRYFERAIELDPRSVAARANLGLALEEQGRTDAALDYYEKLIAADPATSEYRWNRGLALLARGDYARGWDDYEMRNERHAARPRAFPYARWDGAQLRPGAALLVYAEQGVGDEIMFASCVPDLLARGMDCVIECDPRLSALFKRSFPAARIHGTARNGDRSWLAAYSEIEAQIATGSLPQMLRRSADDFPPQGGYLHADSQRIAHWKSRLAADGAAMAAGISWRGGTVKTRRALRSIPMSELMALLRIPNVTFVNLQRDAEEDVAAMRACGATILNYADALGDLNETAALLQALDFVVTTDNTAAHLAGALGCQTLIMLSLSADWRWLNTGVRSAWYPSANLLRQRQAGIWTDVVGAAASLLAAQTARR